MIRYRLFSIHLVMDKNPANKRGVVTLGFVNDHTGNEYMIERVFEATAMKSSITCILEVFKAWQAFSKGGNPAGWNQI